jgi:4-amino-4-deoxy-L-arabinose transferase-like glycosyltransferase
MFYLNYKFASEKKYYLLFIVGYSLCGLAFLTKGIPAIVFQIMSVSVALIVNRELKKVFSVAHLLGIFSMMAIIGSYFLLYQCNGGSVNLYFSRFWQETMLNNGYSFKMLIRHFFSFPAYNIGAFLPFGFLVPLLFIRSNFIQILKNRELLYLFLLSFLGLSVFWVSPYYLPYYSIMFIPLVGDILLFLMPKFQQDSSRVAFNAILFICIVLLLDWLIGYTIQIPIYSLAFVLLYLFRKYIIDVLLIISLVFIVWKAIGSINTKLIDSDKQMQTKDICAKIVDKYPDTKFLIMSEETPYNYVTVFYLTWLTSEIVEFADAGFDTSALLLAGEEELNASLIVVDTIPQLHWEAGGSEKFLGASVYRPLFVVRNK